MPETPFNLNTGLDDLQAIVTSDISAPQHLEHSLKRFVLLDEAVTEASGKHIISPLPDQPPAASADYSHSRIRTIRSRLYNLGYLVSDNKSHLLDQSLKNGITRFQQDAALGNEGFAVDGWVGEQTWDALQQLVSFEDSVDMHRWFHGESPNPALIRASHLRLFALGLMKEKPGRRIFDPTPALQHFCQISRILGLSDEPVKASLCLQTASLLFAQDELIKRLAASTAPKNRHERAVIALFVMNMARIELWMLGFAIEPDGSKSDLNAMLNHHMELKMRSPMFKSLQAYWAYHKADITKASIPARLFVKSSFPDFFAQLLKDTSTDTDMDAETVYEVITEHHISLDTVWQHVASFGSRLWDGIRRIWGWFKNIIIKAADAVVAFIKGLSRLAYQYVLKAYETVKAVIAGFSTSVRYLCNPEMAVKPGMKSCIRHDGDFDFKLLLHKDDDPADISDCGEMLAIRSRIFLLSSRILAALIDVLKRTATAFLGWAWMIMALLRLYKRMAHISPELIRLQKSMSALKMT